MGTAARSIDKPGIAQVERFRKVSDIARLLNESSDLQEVLKRLTEGVCRHSNWSMSSIQVLDLGTQRTRPIVRFDPSRPEVNGLHLEWDASGSPLKQIVETGQPLILADASRQEKYRGFRDDARQRGYRTVVMIPLKFPDEQGRPIVFTVLSSSIVQVDEAEMGFLQCLADLADVAVCRMRVLRRETEEAERLYNIVVNLNTALTTTLDADSETDLFSGLSRLFPTGWFAIDLTTGRTLCDIGSAPPSVQVISQRPPDAVIRAALRADTGHNGQNVCLIIDGLTLHAHVRSLVIDGIRVGALFFPDADQLGSIEQIAAEAGRLALSTLILRNYLVFKTRGSSSRRLMKRLFSGELLDHDDMLDELRVLGFEPAGAMRLVAVRRCDAAPVSEEVHSFVLRKVQQFFDQAISCALQRDMYFLVSDNSEIDDARQREEFQRTIAPMMPPKLTIVASGRLEVLGEVSSAYEACRRNLQLADAMGAEGWVSNREIGSFSALMAAVGQAKTREFLTETIGPLLHAESSKERVALETLEAYLATGRRPQETADRLGIHVSTLRYRLDRLIESYGLDLNDANRCFELELALRLLRLRDSYQNWKKIPQE